MKNSVKSYLMCVLLSAISIILSGSVLLGIPLCFYFLAERIGINGLWGYFASIILLISFLMGIVLYKNSRL